eukprot:2592048-Rhodomonas_salina.2
MEAVPKVTEAVLVFIQAVLPFKEAMLTAVVSVAVQRSADCHRVHEAQPHSGTLRLCPRLEIKHKPENIPSLIQHFLNTCWLLVIDLRWHAAVLSRRA